MTRWMKVAVLVTAAMPWYALLTKTVSYYAYVLLLSSAMPFGVVIGSILLYSIIPFAVIMLLLVPICAVTVLIKGFLTPVWTMVGMRWASALIASFCFVYALVSLVIVVLNALEDAAFAVLMFGNFLLLVAGGSCASYLFVQLSPSSRQRHLV